MHYDIVLLCWKKDDNPKKRGDGMEYPRLRHGLEAVPFQHDNREMFLLKDRAGFSETPMVVSRPVALLLMHMDGRHSLRDLQEVFLRATGDLLFTDKLQGILKTLDEGLFLESDRFAEHARTTMEAFRGEPIRRMQLSGKSYPGDPARLRTELDRFFAEERGGPGPIGIATSDSVRPLLGIVAPHIDLQAGGPCFAHAYKAIMEARAPETWVILGTGHEPVVNQFCLTAKDFETPLGTVACDRELTEALARRVGRDIRVSEYNHAREHSIEFQAVFLACYQPRARIVPILCSFSHDEWVEQRAFIDDTAALLRDLAGGSERSVGIMASVDLAHVGPRYGDGFHPGRDTVLEHLEADRALLMDLERCDAVGFMRRIARERNRRKVCGVAPLYMLAAILGDRVTGRTLHHTHATVDSHKSFVTFASMAFFEKEDP